MNIAGIIRSVLILLLLSSAGCQQTSPSILTADEAAWLEHQDNRVEVLFGYEAPPNAYHNRNGEYVGLLMDFFRLIEDRMGVNIRLKKFAKWSDLMEYAKRNQNYIIVGIAHTKDRATYLSFTSPFVKVPYVIITRQHSTITSMPDLVGKKVCTVSRYAINDYIEQIYPKIVPTAAVDNLQGLRSVSSGECDAMIINQMYASYIIEDQGITNLKIVGESGYLNRLSAAASIQDTRLFNILEKVVDSISIEEQRSLYLKWVRGSGTVGLSQSTQTVLIGVLIVMGGVFILFILWTYTLRVQVAQRTKKVEEMNIQLRHSQKLETIGTMTGGIAHDFNNILTPILGYADLAISDLDRANPAYEYVEHILEGAERAKDLVAQILLFSKQAEKERHSILLKPLLKEVLRLLRPSIPASVEIVQSIDDCPKVFVDAVQIHQVVVNLCTNSWQAMEETGGKITISLTCRSIDDAVRTILPELTADQYVCLSIGDTGSGMAPETMDRIFEPFYSTKPVNKGSGLGLSVVHGIIQSHGGAIHVESELNVGTTFYVYLPVSTEVEDEGAKTVDAVKGGLESILVVDDEPAVANVVRFMLERVGYTVQVCTDADAVMLELKKYASRYALLISDLTMPGMTGLDLADEIRRNEINIPIMLMTGYVDQLSDDIIKKHDITHVILKPIAKIDLLKIVRNMIDSSKLEINHENSGD